VENRTAQWPGKGEQVGGRVLADEQWCQGVSVDGVGPCMALHVGFHSEWDGGSGSILYRVG
jgi:hypothetical protein